MSSLSTSTPPAKRTGMGGGAGNEAGGQHRSGVAAFLAAAGLTDHPVGHDSQSIPAELSLETDQPTDDITCTLRDGTHWFIQAKITGKFGAPLDGTLAQWAKQPVTGEDRIVMASASFSNPLASAQSVLEHARYGHGIKPNAQRKQQLDDLLIRAQQAGAPPSKIRQHAEFMLCDTGDHGAARSRAAAWLDAVVGPGNGEAAFDALVRRFQKAGVRQETTQLDDWISALDDAGHPVGEHPSGTAGQRRASQLTAIAGYRSVLAARANRLDIGTLVPGMAPIDVPDLLDSWELSRPSFATEERGAQNPAWVVARRETRLLIEGLAGIGKSTMLQQLAAHLASDDTGPVPLLIRFGTLATHVQYPEDVTLQLLLSITAAVVNTDHHSAVVEDALAEAIHSGHAIFLIDGLDETFAKLNIVLSGLRDLMTALPSDTGWVLTSRPAASAVFDTEGLGFEKATLQFKGRISSAIEAIARNEATAQGIPEDERHEWFAERTRWNTGSEHRRSDGTLEVPLHLMLIAVHAAREGATTSSALDLLPVIVRSRAAEAGSSRTTPPDGWDRELRPGMALDLLLSLGHHLSDKEADSYSTILDAGVEALSGWELPAKVSRRIASQLIWFWDEKAAVIENDGNTVRGRRAVGLK